MRILLTGGAGYVGSACFRTFRRHGLEAFVFDDLSEGHAAAVRLTQGNGDDGPGDDGAGDDRLETGDLRDTEAVARVLRDRRISHVVHLAALTSVPGSVLDPAGYWSVNVDGTRSLLEAMRATGVGRIVLSSTAAVYAHGHDRPIREDDRIAPATPYGTSKLAAEHLLAGYAAAYGMGAVALRYFNAAGADADGRHGEAHRVETHVIPLLIAAAQGQRPLFRVFGNQWPTPDGSCIRDFVSVHDLAEAHLLALQRAEPGRMQQYNLGSGQGCSVLDLLAAARRITGSPIPVAFEAPRAGDPPVLVADISRAREALGWTPRTSGLQDILTTALHWHARNPSGYGIIPDRA